LAVASEAAKRSPIEHFSGLKDPRQAWKVVGAGDHAAPALRKLGGSGEFHEVRFLGLKNLVFQQHFLPVRRGVLGNQPNALRIGSGQAASLGGKLTLTSRAHGLRRDPDCADARMAM